MPKGGQDSIDLTDTWGCSNGHKGGKGQAGEHKSRWGHHGTVNLLLSHEPCFAGARSFQMHSLLSPDFLLSPLACQRHPLLLGSEWCQGLSEILKQVCHIKES